MSLIRHDFVPQPVDITILFVTPENKSVTQLSELLISSPYVKSIKWIDSEHHFEDRVERHLLGRRPEQAFVVVLDFKACGSRAWTLISSAHAAMPHANFEWVITRHSGRISGWPGIPWHRVTLLDETST